MSQEEIDDNEKRVMFFGRDISKIPCFRNSILYGIGGGLFCGLGRFMFTSHTLKSVNFSVYSFSAITLAYWLQCRYKYTKMKFEMMQLQEALKNHVAHEGTEEDTIVNPKVDSNEPVEV